jgi:hypothetical protein
MLDLGQTVERWPFHQLLPQVRRSVAANGQCHLVVDGKALCDGQRLEADPAWHGRDALPLATCPACRQEGERILFCVEQEAEAIERAAGPLTRMLADHIIGPAPDGKQVVVSKEEVADLERKSYTSFWLSLAGAALVTLLGLPALGLLWALGASLMRLFWTLSRGPLERQAQ